VFPSTGKNCVHSILALPNKFIRRTLQLEGVTSLKMAVQRAMTIKVILDNNSEREKEYRDYNRRGFEGKNNFLKEGNIILKKRRK